MCRLPQHMLESIVTWGIIIHIGHARETYTTQMNSTILDPNDHLITTCISVGVSYHVGVCIRRDRGNLIMRTKACLPV